MTELNQVWKCNVCGNVVETVHTGKGQLVCCGKPMEWLKEKTKDVGYEKHLPVTEWTGTTLKVKVGATPHPMEETHYIEWVEVLTGDRTWRKYYKPGDEPWWTLETKPTTTPTTKTQVRAYCNVHGLWKT